MSNIPTAYLILGTTSIVITTVFFYIFWIYLLKKKNRSIPRTSTLDRIEKENELYNLIIDFTSMPEDAYRIAKKLKLKPGSRVLDIGTYQTYGPSIGFADAGLYTVAIDLYSKKLFYFKRFLKTHRRSKELIKKIDLETTDARRLGIKDSSVDLIIFRYSLKYIRGYDEKKAKYNLSKTLHEAWRVLKDGGTVIVRDHEKIIKEVKGLFDKYGFDYKVIYYDTHPVGILAKK